MSYTFNLSNEYGYVILTAAASLVMSNWLSYRTGGFRIAAKLSYPTPYATLEAQNSDPKAYAYNCAARAHANTLEQYPGLLVSLLLSGVQYPKTAAALGLTWIVSRVMYATGYTASKLGDGGAGRSRGLWGFFPQLGLQGLTALVGFNVLTAKPSLF
ncbi:MAG: hypothetical protein M1816_004337 [Peltula sp. TS41687]|nr:MAG: hypothetical protein M1816_004337 [Peltula sp. TS41687]